MRKNSFVHLHVHTEYSLLDGLSKIKELLNYVKENGMDSVAITDHGVMYGAIEFYKNTLKEEVKPIIGMEAYTTNIALDKKPEKGKSKNFHLLLLAKNLRGYRNLMELTSIAHLKGYYYRPRFDLSTLKKYSEGLICTSSCPQGEIPQLLIDDEYDKALEKVNWFLDCFGEDFYLELQRHDYRKFVDQAEDEEVKNNLNLMQDNEEKMNDSLVKISREKGIPLVATNDAHYIKKEDATAQDALVCVSTGKNISDIKRLRFIDTPDFYIKSPKEMAELFSDLPDAVENTLKIAEKCDIKIELGQWHFPKVILPKGKSAEVHFRDEVNKGLIERYKKVTKEVNERVKMEVDTILDKGYAPYFLIYQDMANWAYSNKIPINTRGSVAGSIVSYSLGITTVDPIKYNLPFERFLNPYRPSAPDIDMDISDDKREEMIHYLVQKYGHDKVAQICTFGRMLARGSVRDVARVLGFPYETGDKIAKLIPQGQQGFPMTIQRALDESEELAELYNTDQDTRKIVDLARQIEGNARHISVHAAGVVISPTKLTDFTPVQLEPSGEKIITQYEMWSCEDVGLVKLDILGIRNLSILREAVEWVKKTRSKDVNLAELPLDDKKTFAMLAKGETMGTFQLSGSGMTRFLVELAPERIEDIMAMIALYRPGPMANIPDYIARKKGRQKIEYYHPKMESYLDKSFGILVYQDDLLFTALELAGYDWLEVDKFRKAVGKKIPEEMAKQHKKFVEGCMDHSKMTKKEAEAIWKLFEPFQGYGFNKAHAASYGMVAYQTSYMKANYPVEFMCALLTAESNDTDKVSSAVNECKRMGIRVMPPHINKSAIGFGIVDDPKSLDGRAIRFGLSAIKNVGDAAINAILEERESREFISFADFLSRVDSRKVNKRVLESLIKVGALNDFGNRATLISQMDELRNKVSKSVTDSNQQGLFSQEEIKKSMMIEKTASIAVDEFTDQEIENLERTLLGFSLSGKPVIELIKMFMPMTTHKIQDIFEENVDSAVKIAGVVEEVRIVVTRTSGKQMAFVKLKDDTGSIDLVIFPNMYRDSHDIWLDNTPVLITGKINSRNDEISIIVDKVDTTETVSGKKDHLFIRIPKDCESQALKKLRDLLIENQGNQKVSLLFEENGGRKIDLNIKINWDEALAFRISEILNRSESGSSLS